MPAKSSDDETLRMPAVTEPDTDAENSSHTPATEAVEETAADATAGRNHDSAATGGDSGATEDADTGATAAMDTDDRGDRDKPQSVAEAVESAIESPDSTVDNQAMTTVASKQSWWKRFKAWRKRRPFAGGLLLILSGIAIAAPAYITVRISDLLVMISTVSGVSTLLIGVALIMFGLGSWFRQETSTYLGVLGILVAIIAIPTSNLGGFLIGSLLGIIGGALAFAWQPQDRKKSAKKKKSQAKEMAVST